MMDLTDSERELIEAARRAREAHEATKSCEMYSREWAEADKLRHMTLAGARDRLDAIVWGVALP
jgi:hypothetical protein